MIPRRPMTSRYQQIFFGHCYSCNKFGHKNLNCKAYEKFHVYKKNTPKKQKNYKKTKSRHQNSAHINMKNENIHYKQEDQRFSKYKKELFGYFHCCHNFGHKPVDFKTKGRDQTLRRKQDTNTSNDRRPISRVPHGKMWRIKSHQNDSEETQISNINEVSKDDDEHNSAINKNDIHYEEKQDGDVKNIPMEMKDIVMIVGFFSKYLS